MKELTEEDLEKIDSFEKEHQTISRIANMIKATFGRNRRVSNLDFIDYIEKDANILLKMAWNFYTIDEKALIVAMLIRNGILYEEEK